jgi:hypothetical protein
MFEVTEMFWRKPEMVWLEQLALAAGFSETFDLRELGAGVLLDDKVVARIGLDRPRPQNDEERGKLLCEELNRWPTHELADLRLRVLSWSNGLHVDMGTQERL